MTLAERKLLTLTLSDQGRAQLEELSDLVDVDHNEMGYLGLDLLDSVHTVQMAVRMNH